MGSLMVVVMQISFQIFLHFINRLIPLGSSLDAEMLVQQGSVQSLDNAVALGGEAPWWYGVCAFKLQEEFIGMLIRSISE